MLPICTTNCYLWYILPPGYHRYKFPSLLSTTTPRTYFLSHCYPRNVFTIIIVAASACFLTHVLLLTFRTYSTVLILLQTNFARYYHALLPIVCISSTDMDCCAVNWFAPLELTVISPKIKGRFAHQIKFPIKVSFSPSWSNSVRIEGSHIFDPVRDGCCEGSLPFQRKEQTLLIRLARLALWKSYSTLAMLCPD